MLLDLLTAGAACAFGALLISLRLPGRGRRLRAALLFAAMLALLLARLYPRAGLLPAVIGLAVAVAYAVLTVRQLRRERGRRG